MTHSIQLYVTINNEQIHLSIASELLNIPTDQLIDSGHAIPFGQTSNINYSN